MMTQKKDLPWDSESLLLDLILSAKDRESLRKLLDELLTPKEKLMFEVRVGLTKALLEKHTFKQIQASFGASNYIIARTNREIVRSESQYIVTFLKGRDRPELG